MSFSDFIKKNSRSLLTIVSSIGVVSTAVCAGRDTLKAEKKLEESEAKTLKEKAKATWKSYIPTAVSASLTIGSIVLNAKLTAKELAALTAMIGSSGYLLNEYKEAIKEKFGDEGYNEVVRTVAKHHEDDIPYAAIANIETTGSFYATKDDIPAGDTLFFDDFSQTFFRSSTEAVRLAMYHFNRNFSIGGTIDMMSFYEFLGIEEVVNKKKGAGWYNQYGYGWAYREDGLNWIDFELIEAVSEKTKENYYIISYTFAPEDLIEGDDDRIESGYLEQGYSEAKDSDVKIIVNEEKE